MWRKQKRLHETPPPGPPVRGSNGSQAGSPLDKTVRSSRQRSGPRRRVSGRRSCSVEDSKDLANIINMDTGVEP